MFIKHISALAFIPVENGSLASDLLLQHEDCPDEAKPIVKYFIHTYIGVDDQQPLFPIRFWSVYDRTTTNCFRTNNCVEGWHRRFKSVMQCANPGVFKCIEKIMKEQKTQSLEMQRLNAGEPPQKKQKKYRALDQC